jgi:hypothetical protein
MRKILYLDEVVVRQQLVYGISKEEMCEWWDVPEEFLDDFIEKKKLKKYAEEGLTCPDSECKVCISCGVKKHELKFQKGRNQCHLCRRKKKSERYYIMIREILEEQGRKYACEECGYDKNLSAIQFHHRDEREKTESISRLKTKNAGRDKIKAELAKCDVLCATCHSAIHNPHLKSDNFFEKDKDE